MVLNPALSFYLLTTGFLLVGALALHILPRLGTAGKFIIRFLSQAPGLDWAIAYFTLLPPIVGTVLIGWLGFFLALVAEFSALWLWIIAHELTHLNQWNSPRIHRSLSRIVGPWRNHLALWLTSLAVPCFWMVRLAQLLVYPPLIILVKFPAYNTGEWVNISRQKFEGLVGYDLIWCLYCDWMTGVWSLGTEMLRNVESFWCPIRFASDKKCENCKIDFPDIEKSWVAANSSMADVTDLLQEKYAHRDENSWYGHSSHAQPSNTDA